jgi:hypothetical protein
VEAAHITWRPLGRLLVEQGLLDANELELALAQQQQTGRRLGETLVECGFVSGPQLASALAAQYGLELTTEHGFGTGLRSEIQRRHEHDRRRTLRVAPEPPAEPEPAADPTAESSAPEPEALLLAQLEEQWAKLAAAEDELRQLGEDNEALRAELEALRRPPAHPAAAPSSHLLFVSVPGGYELAERNGPPPSRGALLELSELGGAFVAAGLRSSPLPADGRPCVIVEPV